MSHKEFFEQQRLAFAEETKRKISQLRENDKLVDTMPEGQVRAYLRFLLNENLRLEQDNERLMEMLPDRR